MAVVVWVMVEAGSVMVEAGSVTVEADNVTVEAGGVAVRPVVTVTVLVIETVCSGQVDDVAVLDEEGFVLLVDTALLGELVVMPMQLQALE